ncbi:polymorphic toxin type 10 domain-containing protein [Leptospira santarosai]|nr:polymorphic toxin type 10 domain-containing protein [Leptospira santarosai]MDI7237167.1 polymorphic toxin type 10 domain-containing protein [Leptospira santarosai]
MQTALSAPTPVNAVVNSAVATGKGVYELAKDYKGTYNSAKDFAGKLTSKDDKVRDYAAGQAKAYTMSAVLGGMAGKALGSRLPKPNVDVPGNGGKQNWPTTRKELTDDLSKKGFGNPRASEGGYVTYKGPDGKKVTVKPTGEVITTQKVWAKDGLKKYPERLDYDGNRLSNQSHSTGHFVK